MNSKIRLTFELAMEVKWNKEPGKYYRFGLKKKARNGRQGKRRLAR
jgi:hypothetical protein